VEKFVYLLDRPKAILVEDFKATILGTVIATLRAEAVHHITVNIADLSEQVLAVAPQRIIGPCEKLGASIEFWHNSLDERAPIEACFESVSDNVIGYLVTESTPQIVEREWKEGERRPGVTQFGANGKPPSVSDEDFYHNWQVLHSVHSFELHPLRWSYVRNSVARPLTSNAPAYRAIVSEHFKTLDDFTDESRYFGPQEVVEHMFQNINGFCDLELMISVPMSEYYFD
jgi:hypothetical protein